MAENLLLRPKVSGIMRISPNYSGMGLGTTNRVCLIGHADGLELNNPYQVNNMQEAVNALLADTVSPLLRALLEAYNNGCRDIWLVAAAPMSEYEPVIENRLTPAYVSADASPTLYTFYEKYYERLTETYAILRDYDFPEIIVPIEAVYYDTGGVDFHTQLVTHCVDAVQNTGVIQLGIMGTRIPNTTSTETAISEMVAMSQATTAARAPIMISGAKYTMVVVGEGLVNFPQLNFSYSCSLATQAAAAAATMSIGRSLTYAPMTTVVNTTNRDFKDEELIALTNAKLNPVIRRTRAKRGIPFNTVLLTDNTMGMQIANDQGVLTQTDFWSMAQMRLVATCVNYIRALGYEYIRNTDVGRGYADFKQQVFDYLRSLVVQGAMKDFDLSVTRNSPTEGDILDTGRAVLDEAVLVQVGLTPYFGIRQIFFTAEVGPGV